MRGALLFIASLQLTQLYSKKELLAMACALEPLLGPILLRRGEDVTIRKDFLVPLCALVRAFRAVLGADCRSLFFAFLGAVVGTCAVDLRDKRDSRLLSVLCCFVAAFMQG